MEKERGTDRLGGRESCFCCNVMLNSNMQCSHHGNGGSSEAMHGAENVCSLACLCTSACFCAFCVKVQQVSRADPSSRRGGSVLIRVQRKKKAFKRSLKKERRISFPLSSKAPDPLHLVYGCLRCLSLSASICFNIFVPVYNKGIVPIIIFTVYLNLSFTYQLSMVSAA